MIEKGIDGANKKGAAFDKNRFIGVAGRYAFHVFDLDKMRFVLSDGRQGYQTLC